MLNELLVRARRYRGMAVMLLAVCAMGLIAAPASAVSVSLVAADGVSDSDVDDLMEEDEEAASERSGCNLDPFCDFPDGQTVIVGEDEDKVTIPFKADILCEQTYTGTMFFFLDGHLVFLFPFIDEGSPRCFDLEVRHLDNLEPGESIELKVKVLDNRFLTYTYCSVIIKKECDRRPVCYFNDEECGDSGDDEMMIYDVQTGDTLPVIEICARSRCGNRARVELFSRPPFMEPISHAKGGHGERVCIETRSDDIVEGGFAEGTYWAKFRCSDVHNGRERVLKVGFRYSDPEPEVCDDPPACEALEGAVLDVDVDATGMFTICGSSPCDDCDVTIVADSLPSFVMAADDGEGRGVAGESCATYIVAPTVGDVGVTTVGFTVTDCNGATSACSIDINVPAPLLACSENEAVNPNDTFADATVIDAGDCIDGAAGVTIDGVLDNPVFMSGDVDYYRFTGLTPDGIYSATIVAGMNGDNGFTDTMLGWLAAEGVVVAMDDNSGPRAVYSKIEFIADEDGVAVLAVTGHGDEDFNGMMSGGMDFEEYGRGGYMLSVRGVIEDIGEMPLERQADLNGDGVVDTGDLGMLIGVFGASSN